MKECPNCHDANSCGDYEGPTCEVCMGIGRVPDCAGEMTAQFDAHGAPIQQWMWNFTSRDQETLKLKVLDFIDRDNVFGDHFSEHERLQILTLLSVPWNALVGGPNK